MHKILQMIRTIMYVFKFFQKLYVSLFVNLLKSKKFYILCFNYYIKDKKLTNKYSLIGNGEKIKFLYLKKPNIIQENVVSFIQDFPKELNLDKYIDYELQFQKSFVEPLKAILDAIGWKVEKTATLEAFFS